MQILGIRFGEKHKGWKPLPWEEIKKRARILVIDDGEFYYKQLFEKDGYTIEKWDDVDDLPKLEAGHFDIILLDIQGVGRRQSTEEGLGILKHIHRTCPAQIVIAYSNADWSLKYKEFFDMADAALPKAADYVDFKRKLDELLKKRFSMGFYVDRALKVASPYIGDEEKTRQMIANAIDKKDLSKLESHLSFEIDKKDIVQIILQIVQVAIGVAAL